MKVSAAAALVTATLAGLAQASPPIAIRPYSSQFLGGTELHPFYLEPNECLSFDGKWNDRIRSFELNAAGHGKALYCFFWVDWACSGNYHYYKAPAAQGNYLRVDQIPAQFDGQFSSVRCNFGS